MSENAYWLAFSRVSGIGPKRILNLLAGFGSLEAAWKASEGQLRQAGLDDSALTSLLHARTRLDLSSEVMKVKKSGARFLTLVDPAYPPLLKPLPDAPPVLYVLGELAPEDQRALAVVGTRKPTQYGLIAAHDLAREMAARGVTIISGLAHGIDTVAHNGALNGGGRTIAVLGCGIDRVYPPDNADLAHKIARNGALISEFPVGTPPDGRNFPRRNRVISGLALGVLVVEAPEGSGALITATVAAEQGRDVFAVPANIYNKTGAGCNRLIQDGAKLVMGHQDILDELQVAYTHLETAATTERIQPANAEEAALLRVMGADPLHIDDIARAAGLPIAVVSSTLTILELKGLAQMVGHMQYSLTYRP